MARRRSFFEQLAQNQRINEKRAQAVLKQQQREAQQLQRAQENHQRLKAKTEKEAYLEARQAEADLYNAEMEDKISQLEGILKATLSVDDYIDLQTLKIKSDYPEFILPTQLAEKIPLPVLKDFLPPDLSVLAKFIPGNKAKYEAKILEAEKRFSESMKMALATGEAQSKNIEQFKQLHDVKIAKIRSKADAQHAEIDDFDRRLRNNDSQAIMDYCILVLESSIYPDGFPQKAKIAYVPESKQLVIEYDLPTWDVIPEEASFKYVKTKDEITSTVRPVSQRKTLYTSVISQITLRTVHELFEADRLGHLETIVFNGYVESVDKATGRDIRTCLITLRTTRDVFMAINLARVESDVCLKNLGASVSKSPSELVPVRPVIEFNMVDTRFVQEVDVISTLDTRPNLMELTPSEFESLITNLFQKMGLVARQTQASRDGGVDCVAFDPRPIFGGKVVIQAKRYKNTVGVSAVRDLYGTLQNEGASKGILVTTSGYGKASFDFAKEKPIELLSGSNLLYLLEEYAQIRAKIEMPQEWRDPNPDSLAE